jgi:hypothetical protein
MKTMKTMKTIKILSATMVAAGVLTAPNLFAALTGTITVTPDYGNAGGGGAFTAVTSGLGTFDTFCLETTEQLTYGYPYSYQVNSGAVNGGAGTARPDGGATAATATFDPISLGTAWLYSQFRAGTLANYTVGSAASANALQQAIWGLEDEVALDTSNTFYQEALAAVGAGLQGDANGAYGVVVLNDYSTLANGQIVNNQDVLAVVPEASTTIAGALLLLPLGASAVRIMRKKSVA